jgi:N-acyl-L-homoserine lactone synthetase
MQASLSRVMVATQQVWENMACRLTTRMAKLGFDSQKAVVNIYALMLLFTRQSSSSN